MQITDTNKSTAIYKTPNVRKSPSFAAKIQLCAEDEFLREIVKYFSLKEIELDLGKKYIIDEAVISPYAFTLFAKDCTVNAMINKVSKLGFLSHLIPAPVNIGNLLSVKENTYKFGETLHKTSENCELGGFILGSRHKNLKTNCNKKDKECRYQHEHSLELLESTRSVFNQLSNYFGLNYSIFAVQKEIASISVFVNAVENKYSVRIRRGNHEVTTPDELDKLFAILRISPKDRVVVFDRRLNKEIDITDEIRKYQKEYDVYDFK